MKIITKSVFGFLILLCLANVRAQEYTPKKIDSLVSSTFKLADRNKALNISLESYKSAKKIGYFTGQANSLKASINSYFGLGEQQKALACADQLFELASDESNDYYCVQALIAKSLAYSYLGFFDKAYETSRLAEKECQDLTDGDEFNTSMGQIYAGRSEIMNLQYQLPQNTIKNDLKSIEYYKKIKDPKKRNGWLAIQYSSIGYTYIDLDKYEDAIYYSRKAYHLSKAENDSINQAFGLYGIGNAYLSMNKTDSSLFYYKRALPIFEKAQDIYRLQYIYDDMATIYEKLNDEKLYGYYSKKSKELYDVIRKKEKIETDKISKNIIDGEKSAWYKNLYLIITGLVLFFIVKMYFTVKIFKRYQNEKRKRVRARRHLMENQEVVSQLEIKVNDSFSELLELAKSNDSSFLSRFKESYPVFYKNLTTEYPDMTIGQLKFCALLKLNFSTKEIAQYTNISVRSVEMKKNRLRKQLDIPSDVDLNTWMMDF